MLVALQNIMLGRPAAGYRDMAVKPAAWGESEISPHVSSTLQTYCGPEEAMSKRGSILAARCRTLQMMI